MQVIESFIGILFEDLGYQQVFINYLKYDQTLLPTVKKILKFLPDQAEQVEIFVANTLFRDNLKKAFQEE